MGHDNSPKMTITAEEAVLHCDRTEGVLKVFLRNSVIDVGGNSVAWPGVQEREIPLSDASRAHSSGMCDESAAAELARRDRRGASRRSSSKSR